MKHDIDIFYTPQGYPSNHRWDSYRNANLLNIVFQGGTFGHFLKYFIEKFSTRTPEVYQEPFTPTGTSHKIKPKDYSGLIQKYHSHFINDNEGETDLPVCLIMPTTKKHFLYLKKSNWFRAGDKKISPDDLWEKAVGEMDESIKEYALKIIELYKIQDTAHFSWIPKFIVRDWYKLEFLQDLNQTYNYQWFEEFRNHVFFKKQNTYQLDLETFFDWDHFILNITELDRVFGLDIDFDQQSEMKELFEQGLSFDQIRQECNLVSKALESTLDTTLVDLDVAMEAFIYAEMEKDNPDIQMPLTNRFFRDAEEIRQFIEYYPNWYRRPNPNIK